MGWQFRRSTTLFPGVRLNFTKNGVGLGFGGHGLRYSMHSTGRRTVSVGIPGSGLYWTDSWNAGPPNSPSGTRATPPRPPRPRSATGPVVPEETPDEDPAGPVVRSLSDLADELTSLGQAALAEAVAALGESLGELRTGPENAVERAVVDRLLAAAESAPLPENGISLGIQPMPGFEAATPLTIDSALLLCAAHLLAVGDRLGAERLAGHAPASDESLLVIAAIRMHDADPGGVLELGVPLVDSPAAWLVGLIRAEALLLSLRPDEALTLLRELSEDDLVVDDDAQDVCAVLIARCLLAQGRPLEACQVLSEVLARDPFDTAAGQLLGQAHEAMTTSDDTGIRRYETDQEAQLLRTVLASIERELHGARKTLIDLIDELAVVASDRHRVLGSRTLHLARLRTRLAALIAYATGAEADIARADDAAGQQRVDEEKHEQQQRMVDEDAAADSRAQELDEELPEPTDPETDRERKKLYRALCRRWHPDLADSEEDRVIRHEMTTRISQLYRDRDIAGLQHLLDGGDGAGPDSTTDTVGALQQRIKDAREELLRLRDEIERLLQSELEAVRTQRAEWAAQGRDLLTALAQDVDAEIRDLEKAIADLES